MAQQPRAPVGRCFKDKVVATPTTSRVVLPWGRLCRCHRLLRLVSAPYEIIAFLGTAGIPPRGMLW